MARCGRAGDNVKIINQFGISCHNTFLIRFLQEQRNITKYYKILFGGCQKVGRQFKGFSKIFANKVILTKLDFLGKLDSDISCECNVIRLLRTF